MTAGRTPDPERAPLPTYLDLGPDPEPLGERFAILLEREVVAPRAETADAAVLVALPSRLPLQRELAAGAA